jgi:tetratricopeptide (TPR) repeat protein
MGKLCYLIQSFSVTLQYPKIQDMLKQYFNLIAIIILSLSCCFISCSHSHEQETLQQAEAIMEQHPDSAMILLSTLDKDQLSGDRQKAKYALLMSIALDKNYIDTTSFDVLQPAIDYYLAHGTPNEQLRTYYIQGRFYQNKKDTINALSSFARAIDIAPKSDDSLFIANTLIAQASIYSDLYDFDDYTDNYLKAANIYKNLSNKNNEFDCLIMAINGSLYLKNKALGDSLLNLCDKWKGLSHNQRKSLDDYRTYYNLIYDFDNTINSIAESDKTTSNLDIKLTSTLIELAEQLIMLHEVNNKDYSLIESRIIKAYAIKNVGDCKDELFMVRGSRHTLDSIKTLNLELKAQHSEKLNNIIIWSSICVVLILLIVIVALVFHNAKKKSNKKELIFESEIPQDTSIEENNKNMNELPEKLSADVKKAILVRVEMLNNLLASHITSDIRYEKPYDSWVKELTENPEEFMNSNRLAFQFSHPRFIQYFEDHGLTTDEINYVCLYAIGLRGKEIGIYTKKPGHVNMSSAIRKKLGIDKHETNLGIYVRKLMKDL